MIRLVLPNANRGACFLALFANSFLFFAVKSSLFTARNTESNAESVKEKRPVYTGVPYILCILSVLTVGCQLNRSLAPISPGHFFGSEQSRQGIVALEQGNLDEAEKRLEDAVKWNRNDTNHRRHYAEVLWQQGKHQESLAQLEEAVKRGGQNNASLHISLAEKYLAIQEFIIDPAKVEIAYRHADEAVRLAAQDSRSWALRGKAKRLQAAHQGGYAEHTLALLHEARIDYLRAVSLAPHDTGLLMELAAIQMRCGQPEQALATWLTVQSLYPQGSEPFEVLLGKTETLTALRRFDEAQRTLAAIRQRGLANLETERQIETMMLAVQAQQIQ